MRALIRTEADEERMCLVLNIIFTCFSLESSIKSITFKIPYFEYAVSLFKPIIRSIRFYMTCISFIVAVVQESNIKLLYLRWLKTRLLNKLTKMRFSRPLLLSCFSRQMFGFIRPETLDHSMKLSSSFLKSTSSYLQLETISN